MVNLFEGCFSKQPLMNSFAYSETPTREEKYTSCSI
jgi:hypothetical protein